MPQPRRERPAPRASLTRTLLVGGLFGVWLLVLLYSLVVADDPREILLNVVLIGLGLLAGGVAAGFVLQAARHELQLTERRLEAMGGSDTFPWECDPEGRVTFIGERVVHSFGYTAEELVGRHIADLVHPQEIERLAELMRAGAGWRDERWRCIVADGSERWFLGSALPMTAPDGTLIGFTGSASPLASDAVDEQRLSDIAARVYDLLASGDILPVFQPILSVETGRLIGAEALSRFPGSTLPPDRWFNEAAEVGLGVELELLALRRSLDAARVLPTDVYLSLNVSPQVLLRPELFEVLRDVAIAPARIVLEITEHSSIARYDEVLAVLGSLRAEGIRLAVDDAGAGYASFRHILQLSPEIIKLDRSLIAGLHEDPALRALAAAVVGFGTEMASTITAEGVETPEELRALQDLGIHAAQGYLFGKPTADWTTWNEWHAAGPLYSVSALSAG
jgi:PAS domain S-box-containing protein